MQVELDRQTGTRTARSLVAAVGERLTDACRDQAPLSVVTVDLTGLEAIRSHTGDAAAEEILETVRGRGPWTRSASWGAAATASS